MKLFDKDINSISINEIYEFFKLPENSNLKNINDKLNEYIEEINNINIDYKISSSLTEQIQICRNKLLNDFHKRYELKIPFEEKTFIEEGSKVVLQNQYNVSNMNQKKTLPIELGEGKVNPLFRQTYKKIINIDSLFRENLETSSSSDFVIKLNNVETNIVSLSLASVEIPNDFYTISEKLGNNTFVIKLYNMTGQADITHTIILPNGNYYSNELVNVINNYFNNIANGLEFLLFDINSITANSILRARNIQDGGSNPKPYDPADARYSPNFYFEVDFTKNNLKIYETFGWYLGFSKTTYTVTKTDVYIDNVTTNVIITYEGYLNSDRTFGNSTNHYIFLYLDDFNKNFNSNSVTSTLPSSIISNNILGKIVLTEGHNSIIFNDNGDKIFKKRQYYGPVNIEKIHIKLLNKFGKIIDINNNNLSLSLELEKLY